MSESVTAEQAQHWLNLQLEGLNEVRNLAARDPAFRQWRQNTLRITQRIWPEDPARAHRFRRVPFSPPSAKAEERLTRDHSQRGCAEARRLLVGWIQEVGTAGIRPGPLADEAAAEPP